MSNDSERAIQILMNIYTFMNDKTNFFNRQTANLTVADTIEMFRSNRVLFLMRPLQTIMELRAMDADFGIIPTPLMDFDTDRVSYLNRIHGRECCDDTSGCQGRDDLGAGT